MTSATTDNHDQYLETDSTDLSAHLETADEQEPEIIPPAPGKPLATFRFRRTPRIMQAAAEFAAGTAVAPVRQLLAARRRLFHRLKEVRG